MRTSPLARAPFRPPPGSGLARLVATKDVAQIADLKATENYINRDPFAIAGVELGGIRTLLDVPMLNEGGLVYDLVGALSLARQEVRPFSDKQIELVGSFAAQAVIAIENARLLNELREALERQTATAEVLRVISSSSGELKPVFDAMLENATRICDAKFGALMLAEGDAFVLGAIHSAPQAFTEFMRRGLPVATGAVS
jgi:GAF domain